MKKYKIFSERYKQLQKDIVESMISMLLAKEVKEINFYDYHKINKNFNINHLSVIDKTVTIDNNFYQKNISLLDLDVNILIELFIVIENNKY